MSLCAGIVALLLVVAGWSRRREVFGARTFTVAAGAACVWCWAIAAYGRSGPGDSYPYAAVGAWLAAASACVAAVYVMARRAVSPHWAPSRPLVALFVGEALAILVLEVTNPLHHLVGTRSDGVVRYGIAFYVHIAYCFGLMLAAAAALVIRKGQARGVSRRQIVILQALTLAVVLSEVTRLGLTQYIAVAGLAVLYRAMFRQGLNELVPVPRGAAIEQLDDCVFFFDTAGRLVDLNSRARQVLRTREGRVPRVGASVRDVLGVPMPLAEVSGRSLVLGDGPDAVETIVRCTPLDGDPGALGGWLVVARDDDASRHGTDRHDPVTGVLNRAQLDHALRGAVSRAAAGADIVSIALIDVDRFKQINDTYGHVTGDEVLREIAERIDRAARGSATIGRFGGDEFVAVLAGHRLESAVAAAESMRAAVAAGPFPSGGMLVDVTVTIGVAEWANGPVTELIHAADSAMYEAKRAGRNRVRPS